MSNQSVPNLAFTSTAASPAVPWILRPDIEWIENGTHWIAHDPLTRKIYRFGREEKRFLDSLDGRKPLPRLLASLQRTSAEITLDWSGATRLIGLVAQRGLLIYRGAVAAKLADRSQLTWIEWLCNLPWKLLFTRISLWNPDRWLRAHGSRTDCLLAPMSIRFWCSLSCLALMCVLTRWSDWVSHWPNWEQLCSVKLWVGVGFVFLATRVIHELGHAFACVRYGARCVDMGVMMMMGVASPYVDVTDSWRITDTKQRAMISLGGIYFEMIAATLASFVWFATYTGPINELAWQVTVICTISTLVFNANPLMRYDGYYLLCDLLDLPNLRSVADKLVKQFFANLLLGGQTARNLIPDRFDTRIGHAFLISFGVAAAIYRALFLIGICFGIAGIASAWDVRWLGWCGVGLILASSVLVPGLQAVPKTLRFWKESKVQRGRAIAGWSALFVLLGVAVAYPIPQRIHLQAFVQPEQWQPVYAAADGYLDHLIEGDHLAESDEKMVLQAGQPLIALSNPEWTQRQIQAQQQWEQASQELMMARRLSHLDPNWIDRIPGLETMERISKLEWESSQRQVDSLVIRSQGPGRFFWNHAALTSQSSENLMRTSSSFSTASHGTPVSHESLIGWISGSDRWIAQASLSESQLGLIQEGMLARIRLNQRPWEVHEGTVQQIAFSANSVDQPGGSANQSRVEASSKPSKKGGTTYSNYVVQVRLEHAPHDLLPNGSAEVVLHARGCSLSFLAWEWISRNFRLR